MADQDGDSDRTSRKIAEYSRLFMKDEIKANLKKVAEILKKPEAERTGEEKMILDNSPDLVSDIEKKQRAKELKEQRKQETVDPVDILKEKCRVLANAIGDSTNLIVYTGAGISTAASIPDYRGPNGVWTLLQQGKELECPDLVDSEPTYTHMALVKLHREGMVKYLVSQNCDGLHMRSGFPRTALSELHGNMHIEATKAPGFQLCVKCRPQKEYVRLFDTTERTALRKHRTGRHCAVCGDELKDSIVHFGEKGGSEAPYQWQRAVKAADETDFILCLGSSLKVLRKYQMLWSMQKPPAKRPKLIIVNLQWTPKDEQAVLKIHGKCDDVLREVMQNLKLDVDPYDKLKDPIFSIMTPLKSDEFKSTTKKILDIPIGYRKVEILAYPVTGMELTGQDDPPPPGDENALMSHMEAPTRTVEEVEQTVAASALDQVQHAALLQQQQALLLQQQQQQQQQYVSAANTQTSAAAAAAYAAAMSKAQAVARPQQYTALAATQQAAAYAMPGAAATPMQIIPGVGMVPVQHQMVAAAQQPALAMAGMQQQALLQHQQLMAAPALQQQQMLVQLPNGTVAQVPAASMMGQQAALMQQQMLPAQYAALGQHQALALQQQAALHQAQVQAMNAMMAGGLQQGMVHVPGVPAASVMAYRTPTAAAAATVLPAHLAAAGARAHPAISPALLAARAPVANSPIISKPPVLNAAATAAAGTATGSSNSAAEVSPLNNNEALDFRKPDVPAAVVTETTTEVTSEKAAEAAGDTAPKTVTNEYGTPVVTGAPLGVGTISVLDGMNQSDNSNSLLELDSAALYKSSFASGTTASATTTSSTTSAVSDQAFAKAVANDPILEEMTIAGARTLADAGQADSDSTRGALALVADYEESGEEIKHERQELDFSKDDIKNNFETGEISTMDKAVLQDVSKEQSSLKTVQEKMGLVAPPKPEEQLFDPPQAATKPEPACDVTEAKPLESHGNGTEVCTAPTEKPPVNGDSSGIVSPALAQEAETPQGAEPDAAQAAPNAEAPPNGCGGGGESELQLHASDDEMLLLDEAGKDAENLDTSGATEDEAVAEATTEGESVSPGKRSNPGWFGKGRGKAKGAPRRKKRKTTK